MKDKLRGLLIRSLTPLVKIIGKIKAPYSVKPAITTWYHWIDRIEPLDVFLVNTYGHISNIFNPSAAKHAVLFLGWEGEQRIPMIIEAIGEGVIKRPLLECIAEKDRIVAIVRYSGDKSWADASKGIEFANNAVGKPYDFEFDENSQKKFESFFCSELCLYSWVESYPNCTFTKRKTLGVDTVQPIDFIDASECTNPKTTLIFDGRK
jgi:uncharacterized protein YycO